MNLEGSMATKIFINLPVKNPERSKAFFTKLGFKFDPKFCDDQATCMIIGDNIFVMLLVEDFFKGFTGKNIPDAAKHVGVILTLSAASREKVDEMISNAVQAGGKAPGKVQNQGYMYGRGFQDIDGHQWELMYIENEEEE